MGFKETFFPYFESYCMSQFDDIGESIFICAEKKLSQMMKDAEDRGNKYIRWHMNKNILPVISIYRAFQQFERTSKEAYQYTDEVMQILRLKNQGKARFLGCLPFGYGLFRIFSKSAISKKYPEQGWEIQWVHNDKNEVYFNMKRCIYVETTQKYGCPELCPLFCKNDDIVLGGYKPAIVFERNETIAGGSNKCDFHFKNGKYSK